MISRFSQFLLAMSIRAKILGMTAGVVLFLGVGAIVAVREVIYDIQIADLEVRGMSLARTLAARSTQLILTDDRYAIHSLIQEMLKDNPEVRYVIVENGRGTILGHSFPSRVPSVLATISGTDDRQLDAVQLLNSDEGILTDVSVLILKGRIARIRVGLSHQHLDALLAETMRALAAAIGGALLLGLGVALALTHVLTQPITELVSITRAVSGGDLTARAKEHANDEIGELARSFNVMFDNLAVSRAELLQRLRELETLNATAESISGKLSLGELLEVFIKRILELTGFFTGWIMLNDGREVRLAAKVGMPSGFRTEEHGRICPCEALIDEPHSCVAKDGQGGCCSEMPLRLGNGGLRPQVCVPLVAGRRVVGVLTIASTKRRLFGQEELNLLDSLGCQIGLAVENAWLWEQAKGREVHLGQLLSRVISAQEAERKRIARELHDEAGQLLTTLALGMRTIEEAQGLPDAARELVVDSKELVKRLLDEVHRLAVDLRPQALDQFGLVGAVESCVREFGERTALETDMELVDFDDVSPSSEVEITIYRVVQEALANVRKHARASRVGVALKRLNGAVVAIVEDDGIGFDADESCLVVDGHLGLFGMRERATLLNGRLTIESERGHGTTVIVEIPLNEVQRRTVRDVQPTAV